MYHRWRSLISGEVPLETNPSFAFLVELMIQAGMGHLSPHGGLKIAPETPSGAEWIFCRSEENKQEFHRLRQFILGEINVLKPRTFLFLPKDEAEGLTLLTSSLKWATQFCAWKIKDEAEWCLMHVASRPSEENKPLVMIHAERREVLVVGSENLGLLKEILHRLEPSLQAFSFLGNFPEDKFGEVSVDF